GYVQVTAFTGKDLIRLDRNFDEEVSGRSAVRPCLALAGQTHLLPVDDPRWDTNGNGPGTVHSALALAIITWVGNRAAGATTHSAWARECDSAAVFTSKTSTATLSSPSGLAGLWSGPMTACTPCLP